MNWERSPPSCWPPKIISLSDFLFLQPTAGGSTRINESRLSSVFMNQNHQKEPSRAAAGMCFKGKPRPHRALSVKRSNHSFEQLFFLSSAIFSYHPLVRHQPDLLPVFISWPVYHKLKLICPLPRVEIVGNPTVWELSNCFDSSLFFFRHPLEHWKPVLCMNVSKWTSVRCLSFQ